MTNIDTTNVVFGSDPEAFAVRSVNKEVPDLVPPGYLRYVEGMECLDESDKKHPLFLPKVAGIYNGWYQDGAAFETDVTPSKTPTEFFDKYCQATETLSEFLGKRFDLKLWNFSVAGFSVKDFIKMGTEEVKNSCIAGCDPDFDATGEDGELCPTRNLTEWKYRSAGGHLHMSIPGIDLHQVAVPLIRLLAITVGNYSVYKLQRPDLERKRRAQFGSACKYRLPNYPNGDFGVEYRSPNNEWLNTLETVENVFRLSQQALDWVLNNRFLATELINEFLPSTVKAIGKVNQEASGDILSELQLI